jgi:hypothetical protein
MAFVTHDLQCTNGHQQDGVLYKRESGTPACHCGADTRVSWHTGQTPGLSGFGQIMYDGDKISTGDLEAKRQEVQKRHPGKNVQILPDSASQRQTRADDRRQRVIENRKRHGKDITANRAARTDKLNSDLRSAQKRGNVNDIARAESHLTRYTKSIEKSA